MIGEDDPSPFKSERCVCVTEREGSGCRFV